MPPRFAAVTNKEISQIIKLAVPKSLVWKFKQVKLRLFFLEFIDETGEKVFCLQMQIKLESFVTSFS